jgi:hypothetical protein
MFRKWSQFVSVTTSTICNRTHYTSVFQEVSIFFDEVKFQIYLILPAALGLAVYSASNRNEYWKY